MVKAPHFIQDEHGEPIPIALYELELVSQPTPLHAQYGGAYIDLGLTVEVYLPTGRTKPIEDPYHPPFLSHAQPIRQLLYRGEPNFIELKRLYTLATINNKIEEIEGINRITICDDYMYNNIVNTKSETTNSWEIYEKVHDVLETIKKVAQKCMV